MAYSIPESQVVTIVLIGLSAFLTPGGAQCPSFRQFFSSCKIGSPKFDKCLAKALNDVRPCLKYGDPSLNIPILEPISYGPKPVHENIDLMFLKAQVDLFNIVEYAWANSTYLNTKTSLQDQKIDIYQWLPYKVLWGDMYVYAEMPDWKANRTVQWSVELFDVKQRTSIKKVKSTNKLQVSLNLLSMRDVKFQLINAIYDKDFEMMFNTLLHRYWRLVFAVLKPAIYNLINAVQTNLANDVYPELKLEELFQPM
nr:PREDICTED: uncharacterized protein LOC109030826 [Bemisia tabaci]